MVKKLIVLLTICSIALIFFNFLLDFADAQTYSSRDTKIGILVDNLQNAPLRACLLLNQDQECDLESLGYMSMKLLGVTMRDFNRTGIDYLLDRFTTLYFEKLSFRHEGILYPVRNCLSKCYEIKVYSSSCS